MWINESGINKSLQSLESVAVNSLMRPPCSVQIFLSYFGFLEIEVTAGIFNLPCFDIVLYC